MTFSEQLKADIALVEPALEKYLSRETGEGYDRIFEAAKYSAMAGGKRLRPVIVLEFCRLCGGDIEKALPFACALEMIHTYSLIHDDLPCMDNDDLRRGRPTCHKAFDEATAVLAGDGLLTAAFETASAAKDVPAETIVRCIRILGENAGMNGMIGGQVLDMGAEHRKSRSMSCVCCRSSRPGVCSAPRVNSAVRLPVRPTRTPSLGHALTAKSWVWRSRLRTISSISREMPQHSENPSARMRQARNPRFRLCSVWRNAESLRQS